MKKTVRFLLPICFWIGVWVLAAAWIDQELLLPTPISVFSKMSMVLEVDFWRTVGISLLRAGQGYLWGFLMGVGLAALSTLHNVAEMLIRPALSVIRATPVVSFIILALVWLGSSDVPVLAGMLMVVPVVYANTVQGIRSADPKLMEMARAFHFSRSEIFLRVLVPSALPAVIAACETCIGLCFKASIAAEVIGVPRNAIGSRLHQAKIYLETDSLFAWTMMVIMLSMLLEGLLKMLLERGRRHVDRA